MTLKARHPEVFVEVHHPTAGTALQSGSPFEFSAAAVDYRYTMIPAVISCSNPCGSSCSNNQPPRAAAGRRHGGGAVGRAGLQVKIT